MSKWFGKIGYAVENIEVRTGVFRSGIIERDYYGDILRNSRRLQTSDKVNDDINISNEISIVSDAYLMEHFYSIRYMTFCGARWKVTNVEVQPPRLIFTLGGVYNGPTPEASGDPGEDFGE